MALRSDTQTLAQLSPKADEAFSFVPTSDAGQRACDGYMHIGDLNVRLRLPGGTWHDFASSQHRVPVAPLRTADGVLAAADITATMGPGIPLRVTRSWRRESDALELQFQLTNRADQPVEIGGLGMPMVFDNVLTGRSLEQAHAQASFVDPYIGRDAGYLQVTRLNGQGPALLVIPDPGTPLEAYRPIRQYDAKGNANIFTDRTKRGQTAEGFYDWTVASKGFAEEEWKDAGRQWNVPTSITLAPGETRTIGVRFVQSPTIEAIEGTLIAHQRPVAVGVPGYVVPTDLDASLFLKAPHAVVGMASDPVGTLTVTPAGTAHGWSRYAVRSQGFGRARLTISYSDGSKQTVSYYITKPLAQTVADLGHFTTTRQWFDDNSDPFHRAPAILSYDHDAGRIITQEPRVWIAGMSDEGGAGSWVAAMMKQLDNPAPEEVAKLERMVDETVWGKLQVAAGPHAGGVKKSLFYYDPKVHPGYYDPATDWTTWTSWSKKQADDLGRSFNYPHVAIGYWVLYRLARDHQGLVTRHDWRWYLDHADLTVTAMMREAPYYTQFGQMEGEVFIDILQDLRREGMTAKADELEALMKKRADHWASLRYPFGSEMPWDSTGQPEVYAWMRYFGHDEKAAETRDVILGYDPTIPSWGYNGNARRYWDFLYGGKFPRIERQIHHYGSTNNAIPLFDAYRRDPSDLYLLRVAYGGMMGGITNIGEDGFGSAAFHSWPDMMRWDPYTGDYGMGFFGHAYTTATYLVDDPTFGWISFGGNLHRRNGDIIVEPKDSARARVFVAPATLWLTLDAGKFQRLSYDPSTETVTVTLDAATAHTKYALLRVEQTARGADYGVEGYGRQRGAYSIPLGDGPTVVRLHKVPSGH
ncbi:MAG: DUF5695 domain-containing protein [Sphingomonas sp.]